MAFQYSTFGAVTLYTAGGVVSGGSPFFFASAWAVIAFVAGERDGEIGDRREREREGERRREKEREEREGTLEE